MENFLEIMKEIINACIDCISLYVHSPEAFVIDSRIGAFTKEALDLTVELTRDLLDVFGR